MGERGPKPSGRKPRSVRFAHCEVYEAAAAARGLDFTAYVNEVMASAHGLAPPADYRPAGAQLALPDPDDEDEEDAA